jgi:hypothetical protein
MVKTGAAGEIRVNRAPVLTSWAAIVAERLGHDPDLAITLGRAVAGSSARAKARAIGLDDTDSDEGEDARQRREPDLAPATTVRLLGHDVLVTALVQRGEPGSVAAVARLLGSMPFKHNAARRHRIPRARYRVTNWPAYEVGLRRRGDLTFWLDEAALAG